ncbi:GTPase of the mitochondrial inner membrane that associates with the large ribosomal subunit [Basidiobolus ranarum]|uniref:GTPase of the mitochondrial inner membrane that associates with the large ribosomal subunit n=1 Tax=Basidiobolus ranarum TaxID=34480 RepID=A0ABR2WSG4_9FUNG
MLLRFKLTRRVNLFESIKRYSSTIPSHNNLVQESETQSEIPTNIEVPEDHLEIETESNLAGNEINDEDVLEETEETDTLRKVRSPLHKLRDKGSNFSDFKRILVLGGAGGDGCVSFLREKYRPKGPPNGGNGGRGGSIYFETSKDETSLGSLKLKYMAEKGGNGKGALMHGHYGKDLILKIPVGTVVREVEPPQRYAKLFEPREDPLIHYPGWHERNTTEEKYQKFLPHERPDITLVEKISLDLDKDKEVQLICKGGEGGVGNPHFVTSKNRSPKFAKRGQLGHIRYLELELKTLADAGLVGLPNAGKSTFLRAVSNAHPKVAPYPFTTLNPYIGTIDYSDFYQLTVADIPGLIAGAHKNVGLGHSFLRHVERSKVLVYVIDLAKEKPWNDFETLKKELELYSNGLTERASLVVANKADISERAKKNYLEFQKLHPGLEIVPISAKYKKNITKVTASIRKLVEEQNRIEEERRLLEEDQEIL